MDARLLHSLTDALKVAGCSIGEDYVPVLYNSLIQLQSENHFDAVYLWGRVTTSTAADYYIAYGYQDDPIRNRTFFYTQNVLEWVMMPTDWPPFAPDTACKVKSKFAGNVRHVEDAERFGRPGTRGGGGGVVVVGRASATPDDDDDRYAAAAADETQRRVDSDVFDGLMSASVTEETGETEESVEDVSRAETMIKEEDRLAVTVRMIDDECHIVPRGFFYRLPDGHIIKAPYFKGLSYSEIGNRGNFVHVNPRHDPEKGARRRARCDYNGSIDFLESIDKDLPKGCWSSQKIMSNRYAIVRNLLWPGANFVQDMNTGLHGFFYNGDGVKNLDLLFMI